MNVDKIQAAVTLLQEAIDEKPAITLTLDLTAAEVGALRAICWCNHSVPDAVMRANSHYSSTELEMSRMLMKIQHELPK